MSLPGELINGGNLASDANSDDPWKWYRFYSYLFTVEGGTGAPVKQKLIPLSRPYLDEEEEAAATEALRRGELAGDGPRCRAVELILRDLCGVPHVLLTTSCTHALELALLSLELAPGDEVILPSFTFASTANAIALRGARPVFADIEPDTWTLDPKAVASAITSRTRCIMPVHYAGHGADMVSLCDIAERHGLWIVEDAAQGVGASWSGRALGTWGVFGCLSFHNTKDVVCGEGGALLSNDPTLAEKAEILRDKGTNRKAFYRGEVDRYSWVDIGSSYVMGELLAAVLEVQLRKQPVMLRARKERWSRYHEAFQPLARAEVVQLPQIKPEARINWHTYGMLVASNRRDAFLRFLRSRGIGAAFHYVPLHSAAAAARFGPPPVLPVTDRVSNSLVRLPLFPELTDEQQEHIIAAVFEGVREAGLRA